MAVWSRRHIAALSVMTLLVSPTGEAQTGAALRARGLQLGYNLDHAEALATFEEATRAALHDYFASRKDHILKLIAAELKKQEHALVAAFFDGIKGAASNQYSVFVNFGIKSK